MQKFIFVSHGKGTAKRTGNPYDMVTLSNGLEAFPPFNVQNDKISKFFDTIEKGSDVYCDFELEVAYGALRAIIVEASLQKK